jgi:hypothetical protein
VQFMKFFSMQSSAASRHFLPFRSKYSLHTLFWNTLNCAIRLVWETNFHTHKKNGKFSIPVL